MGIVWGPRGPMSLRVPENPADYEGIMRPTCSPLNFAENWGGIGEMSIKIPSNCDCCPSNMSNHGGV